MEPERFEEEDDGEELKQFRTGIVHSCIMVSALITTGKTEPGRKGMRWCI